MSQICGVYMRPKIETLPGRVPNLWCSFPCFYESIKQMEKIVRLLIILLYVVCLLALSISRRDTVN